MSISEIELLSLPWIESLAALGLVFFTGILVWFTHILAREAKRTREAQARPLIVVSVEPWKGPVQMQLVIENLGPGLAKDVIVKPLGDQKIIPRGKEVELRDQKFLNQPMLKPGQRISFLVGTFGDLKATEFQFEASCIDIYGNRHKYYSATDLNCLENTLVGEGYELREITKHLGRLSKDVSSLVTGFKRIGVNVYDKADRDAEEVEQRKMFTEDISEDLSLDGAD